MLPCNDFYKEYIEGYVKLKQEPDRINHVMDIINEGYICSQVLIALYNWVHTDNGLKEIQKIKMVKLCSDIERNIALGGKDDINLIYMFDQIVKILNE